MPKTKDYLHRIPAFYRRSTIDIMLFAHVTALLKQDFLLKDAIGNFFDTYGIDEEEYPVESARTIYNRVRNNFLWKKITDT